MIQTPLLTFILSTYHHKSKQKMLGIKFKYIGLNDVLLQSWISKQD